MIRIAVSFATRLNPKTILEKQGVTMKEIATYVLKINAFRGKA